jgi:hypothetical protein
MPGITRDQRATVSTDEFTSRIESLYQEVEAWLAGTGLSLRTQQATISERELPEYEINSLSIHGPDGRPLATLKPIGMRILGAQGRVDLIGSFGSRMIVYLSPGGPSLTTKTRVGAHEAEIHSRPLFPGVSREGWYTVDQRKLRAQALDKAIFRDLILEVSDYGIQ